MLCIDAWNSFFFFARNIFLHFYEISVSIALKLNVHQWKLFAIKSQWIEATFFFLIDIAIGMEQTKKGEKQKSLTDYKRIERMGQHVTCVDRKAIRSRASVPRDAESKANGTR